MGAGQSQESEQVMTNDDVVQLMEQRPEAVLQYFSSNEDEIEKYIVENFWEEDVERWLQAIRKRSPSENLQIRKIDFLKTRNALTNYTSEYENKNLVIRRASEFVVDVHFGNRQFDAERDDLAVVFAIGSSPSVANESKIICAVSEKPGADAKWSCTVVSKKGKKMQLKINVPANAIVGRYSVSLDIVSGTQEGRKKTTHKSATIIVLFNPFSKADTVYMADKASRDEYVLNDEGFINTGSYGRFGEGIGKRPWDFAQFDEGVLDAVLMMLQKDSRMMNKPIKSLKRCNSPVFVSRVLAAMVNCNDDSGVLMGKWGEEYPGGEKPTTWNGSADIMLRWKDGQCRPVKYGQCWVFSGLMTTALRALGIPARSVTNFASAHDTDSNATIDIYIDRKTWERNDETSDSVWNFHVWNECYFRRPDLPEGYDGWQVVDATPQEESDVAGSAAGRTLMQCGPAPVKAIKEGEINVGFDTGFVFSEVNADKVYWIIDDDGTLSIPPIVKKAAIGKYIGTKAVGKYEVENLILKYKYPEGSPEERRAFNKAYSLGTQEHGHLVGDHKLVASVFEISIAEMQNPTVGDNLSTTVTVKNVSDNKHMVEVGIVASSKTHTGKIHAMLKKSKRTIEIEPGQASDVQFNLDQDEYMRSLVDDYGIGLIATAKSINFGNVEVEELETELVIPECIEVTAPKSMYGGDEGSFDLVLENKFPIKLTNGVIKIAGRGVTSHFIKLGEPLLPRQKFKVEKEKLTPKLGWRRLYVMVIFTSAEVKGVTQRFRVRVTM